MKIYYNLISLILKLLHLLYYVSKSNAHSFDLHKIVEPTDFHQTTSFVAESFTKVSDLKILSFQKFPIIVHSFGVNNSKLFDIYSLKNVYSLQESLVLFYTSDLSEAETFLNFLVRQLSVIMRPKRLIVFSRNFEYTSEVDMSTVLKIAWKKKFLNFSVMVVKMYSSSLIYHYNPFNDVIHLKESIEGIKVFPDKLRNVYKYPFHITQFNYSYHIAQIRQRNRKTEIVIRNDFVIDFTARILNLTIVKKDASTKHSFPDDYLVQRKLDMLPTRVFDKDYSSHFLITADEEARNIVAFLPIIPTSRAAIMQHVCKF